MIWLTWRQFRGQAIAGLAVLAAAAAYFLVTGVLMHHTYTDDLASCGAFNDCNDTLNNFQQDYAPMFDLAQLLVLVAPGLIGIFWGAPLLGRELETGTHQVVWNQSVTRGRWLAVKLAGVGIASVATAGVLSYLLTWWAGPLDQITGNRFAAATFATRDIVPLGYAAFAFALGTTMGLLLRRTVPAMALTLAVFIGVQILMPTLIRPHLLPSTTASFPINQTTTSQSNGIYANRGSFHFDLPIPQDAWVLSDLPVENSAGQVVALSDYPDCFPGPRSKTGMTQIGACLAQYDLRESVTYQPASHYWPLQWLETAIFLGLTAVLFGLCFWWIRRRQN
jgi:ABC-type transport system involved in multi-copper enzyme maturation permease subunit